MSAATFLHVAAWYSAHEIIDDILKRHSESLIEKKTIEGFTPLHISAGVGDFVAVERLCKAGANPETTDTNGRNALHHGVVGDPETAVVLCCVNKKLVIAADSKFQTPVHYALDPTRSACHKFLAALYHDVIKSSRESFNELSENDKNLSFTWIPLNIKAPVCVKPSTNPANGKIKYYDLPTKTFGDIELPTGAYSPNFIRVSDQTDPENMMHIFTKIWNLSRPQLVLSFYGDYTDSKVIREKIRRLIWKASESTKTWVITDGTKRGLSGIASGAVKDFIQAYGEGQVEAIGIAPWKFISDNKIFVPDDYSETGRLADIIIQCIEDTELGSKATYKKSISEGSTGTETFQLSPGNIKQTMEYYWDKITHPELSVLMIQEILEETYLFSICEAESEDEHGELDYHLLSLIMNPSIKENEKPDELNETLLSIAIALNRSDIARDKVFMEGVKWDNSKLVKHMNALLLSNKVQFICVFIEKGFLLSNYLTAERLQLLYTQSIHSDIPDQISLYLIGRALRELVGRQYCPTYMAPHFFLITTGAPKAQIFENPATDLFIWALLTERANLADYFWTQVQDPLPAALFAALLLRRLAMNATSLVTREGMFQYSRSFESKAYSLLTECYNDNQSLSFKTIILERKLFGRMSCLMLAAEGKSMSFISHQCSEQYLERVWNGMIDPRSGMFPFIVALIIGITLPPLVPLSLKFQVKENEASKFEMDKKPKKPSDRKMSMDGMLGEIPFKIYLTKLWKCLEIMAIIIFILGTALQLLVLTEEAERLSFTPVNPVSAIQEALLQLARIFYGLSLCIFYHRILELFTVNIRLGPMVIMVQSMIVRDLIPFLALFTVVVAGFAILQWVTAYQSTASLDPLTNLFTVFKALQLAYFQVFGEYEMDTLSGEEMDVNAIIQERINYTKKKSYEPGSPQELRLIHWERLRFWDYDRYIIQGKKRKQKEGGKMVSVRTTVMQMNRGAEISSEISAAISTYYQTTHDFLTRVESKTDRLRTVEEKVDKVLSLIKELNSKKSQPEETHPKPQTRMDPSLDSRLERILITKEKPSKVYSRSKSSEQPMIKLVQGTKSSQLAVFEKGSHKYAGFVPPTADRTPRLFPHPIPWEKQSQKPMCLGWKPPVYSIEGWTEPGNFAELSEERKLQFRTRIPNVPSPDPITGCPRNPGGRTGVNGKGHLPEWGANSAIILVITRRSNEHLSESKYTKEEALKVIVYKNPLGSQLPWFLVQHPIGCDHKVCVNEIFDILTKSRMKHLVKLMPTKKTTLVETLKKFTSLTTKIIYSGYLDDTINTDNAWIEPTVVHKHISDPYFDHDELIQLLTPEGINAVWLDSTNTVGMRSSHEKILRQVTKRIQSSSTETLKIVKEVKFHEEDV
ncbi:transient receptor potential cation channel,putative [Schistosoma mansoni]|uniref:transient receptor potential cation channel,putative n=1 Tax=Schistosoma mansoni TaxID=6183 RepID=UPI0001A61A8C|nr:transient receptor potential cation channel,putative [Schistosoma mansoni]|eukprot:XP_018644913.1 transient receptor potential cation channel,putative [Schistosoma mansoni]